MAWTNGVIEKTWSFWSCPSGVSSPDSREVVEGLRDRVDLAVRDRLVSDVPLGIFLSGGIDSAVVAESAARQSSVSLKAFTIGFEERSHDERESARLVARALNLEHHEEVLTSGKALALMDDAVALLDEPLADASILPQLYLSRFARSQLKVALSGDGGDELLLGYQHIQAHILAERLSVLPEGLRRAGASVLSRIPSGSGYFSLGFKAQRFSRGIVARNMWARDAAWRGSFDQQTLSKLFVNSAMCTVPADYAEQLLAGRAAEAGLDASLWKSWSWAYLRTFLMDDVMVKVDRATMWFGLESRAPLLDTAVVEYLLRLPSSYKIGKWGGKRLLKELIRGRIPDVVLDRPKHGFAIPVSDWLAGPLRERLSEVTSVGFLKTQGIFQPQTIARLIAEHASRKMDRRKELWALLMFQLWYRAWILEG
jgi:asparagine synthase (glutamine-hydrolysing)